MKNLAQSVRDRLLNQARATGRPFGELLQHFAMERFLYRLGQSKHADRFILKGALMLRAWEVDLARPTRDIDLLGRMDNSVDRICGVVRDCLAAEVVPDGVEFQPDSVQGRPIALQARYSGVRIRFQGKLTTARLTMQLDVGFGDAVVPGPVELEYPQLLDFGRPRILAYTAASLVAEKFQIMVDREAANTRLKDFYDVWLLCRHLAFEGQVLARAIESTFGRRSTPLPAEPPLALTPAFFGNPSKQIQWRAFLRKGHLQVTSSLAEVAEAIRSFVMPPTRAAAQGTEFRMTWADAGPWQEETSG